MGGDLLCEAGCESKTNTRKKPEHISSERNYFVTIIASLQERLFHTPAPP